MLDKISFHKHFNICTYCMFNCRSFGSSTLLGVGYARTRNRYKVYVVARYLAHGNVIGQYDRYVKRSAYILDTFQDNCHGYYYKILHCMNINHVECIIYHLHNVYKKCNPILMFHNSDNTNFHYFILRSVFSLISSRSKLSEVVIYICMPQNLYLK